MFSGTRGPPPPPPPPSSRPRRRLRRDVSLISLSSGDFVERPRYRCCCGRMHLRTASFLIVIIDMISMTAAFARGVYVGRSMQHNPMAISWFVASSLIFILGVFCTLSMMYGLYKERYLWMLPMLVSKTFSVFVCVATTTTFLYMMIEHNQYLLDLVAEHVTRFDYEAARTALRFGGGGLVIGFALMALAQIWFMRVLYRCYQYVKDKYFWLACHPTTVMSTVDAEYERSIDNLNMDRDKRRKSRFMINGHNGEGPVIASVSNSTALTDVDQSTLISPISPSVSTKLLSTATSYTDKDQLTSDCCYTPIVSDINSDRERLWKAFDHSDV